MKINKYLTFALIALALAGCKDDDSPVNPDPEGPQAQGEIIEGITVSFANSKTTYAGETTPGIGTENDIYHAFVFAKEISPTHTRPLAGDWTVKEVGSLNRATSLNRDSLVGEASIATFSGVRQGDYVYVIANHPSLTLAEAESMAHQGESSEDAIRGYIAKLDKNYLNGLMYKPENGTGNPTTYDLPAGKYIMAGLEQIPTSPTVPSNGTLKVTVGLDRELAKVDFKAAITTTPTDAAYQNVDFKEGDGIVVVRIPRQASFFSRQERDFYIPVLGNIENWIGAAESDNTRELFGSTVFDGTKDYTVTGESTVPVFNATEPATEKTEYRYTWALSKNALNVETLPTGEVIYVKGGTMLAPVFYTTPNYSEHTNGVNTICTQATYIGKGEMVNTTDQSKVAAGETPSKSLGDYITATLSNTKTDIILLENTKPEGQPSDSVSVPNPLMAATQSNMTPKDTVAKYGVRFLTYDEWKKADVAGNGNQTEAEYNTRYRDNMLSFYKALLLFYRAENSVTKKNAGTGAVEAEFLRPADEMDGFDSDSLLFDARYAGLADRTTAPTLKYNDEKIKKLFSSKENFEYYTGMKLFYRADIAKYEGSVSNRITERNTSYTIVGTIESLGAKTVHEAITSEGNAMHVYVMVKPWQVVINQVHM